MLNERNNILVTGGSGVIGSFIDFGIKPSRKELDLRDADQVSAYVLKIQPKIIIHLAALTDLKFCEKNPKEAKKTNVVGTKNLAEVAAKIGAILVYLSTNAVFDGDRKNPYFESDVPRPINVYGRTKLEAENVVLKSCKNYLIIRTSWVFGGGKNDNRFVGKIIDQLKNTEIKATNDNIGTPTYAKDLVHTMNKLLSQKKTGLFHVSNSHPTTRFEQAKFITDYFGWRGKLIPCRTELFADGYKHPRNESLASEKIFLRPWQESLKEYLDDNFKNKK